MGHGKAAFLHGGEDAGWRRGGSGHDLYGMAEGPLVVVCCIDQEVEHNGRAAKMCDFLISNRIEDRAGAH